MSDIEPIRSVKEPAKERFDGLRVLVTGGASGLGKAIATRLAAGGARVLITDVNQLRALPLPPGEVSFRHLDVREESNWQAAVEWCESTWDGLDLLVNNAGVAAAGRIEQIELADWDWILDINLKGTVLGCRNLVPVFKRQGSGHIINIASMAGLLNPPGMSSYNTTKAAVIALSETLRHELAPYGVHTTVVCPGFTPTNLGESLRSPDQALAEAANRLISRGTITAEDVAEQVAEAVRSRRFMVLTHEEGRRAMAIKRFLPWLVDRQTAKMWRRALDRINAQDRT